MTKEQVGGLFTLAGISAERFWRLPNQYHCGASGGGNVRLPQFYDEGRTLLDRDMLDFLSMAIPTLCDPWWLIKTPFGLIEIGWRKRVISIDWSDTAARVVVTSDEVTKDRTSVHAWSEEKALEYLKALRVALEVSTYQSCNP